MTFIDDKYAQLGGSAGFLGPPAFPEERITPNGLGSYRHYAGGSIYGRFSRGVAFEVHGLIRQRWAELGWENFRGFPVTDETPRPTTTSPGRASDFESMVISWTPATGAHEVYGAILARWNQLGREGGALGFPTTGELGAWGGGRFNHFVGGSIYYTGATGAMEVLGARRDAWADTNWERGPLRYPTTPGASPGSLPGSSITWQDFQGGSIYLGTGGRTRVSISTPAVFTLPGFGVSWAQLAAGVRLPDGDLIRATFGSSGNPNGSSSVVLGLGPAISWWKGMSFWSSSRGDITAVSAPTSPGSSAGFVLSPAQLEQGNVAIVFHKAKTFGIHTGMYWLTGLPRLTGTNVSFTWLAD